MEKVALYQLKTHIETNDLTTDYQSAYKRNYSCETVLLKIVNDILWSVECKEVSALVAVDLDVAFDTVNHDVLLKTLENKYAVSETALN